MTAGLTDERLLGDLRAHGLVSPVSQAFLASYRADRQFGDSIADLKTQPNGVGRFERALVRLGVLPPPAGADARLIAASDSMLSALRDLEASGPDATEEDDRDAWARFDAAEEVVETTPATSIGGALAKLRRAVTYEVNERWVERAVANGNVTTLAARSEELTGGARLMIEALCALELVAAAT